jgi:hypothetical protein
MGFFNAKKIESKQIEREELGMILKYANGIGEWNYIDGISHAAVGVQGEKCKGELLKTCETEIDGTPVMETIDKRKDSGERIFTVKITQNDRAKAIVTTEDVYLLNDNGRTIERLV